MINVIRLSAVRMNRTDDARVGLRADRIQNDIDDEHAWFVC